MLSFASDYTQGAHEAILERLLRANRDPQPGYGADPVCDSAKAKIRSACACPNADIFFLAGGTETNAVVIDALLERYEGVLCAETGHIGVHEAGAVEFTGHKVLPLPHTLGKIRAADVRRALETFYADESYTHMVFPGMVYISHPTELGTLYTAAELRALSAVCREYHIPLYLDGARLGYGLAAAGTDVTLPLIADCCDAFYIGGTKVGALFGEAVVFPNGGPKRLVTIVKQHGALLAKGFLLGHQFDVLFTDGLYERIGAHAIRMANALREGLCTRNLPFAWESPTNQQFVILENAFLDRLRPHVGFGFWARADDRRTIVRFATSWATTEQNVQELMDILDLA